MTVKTLSVFTEDEKNTATDILSAKVSTMLGRKMEEGDWDFVYCHTKNIPITDWSNLNIDVNHKGLGVEHKMLRVKKSGSILDQCGTTQMHPSGTRSIRIPDENDATKVMDNVLSQYNALIEMRTTHVKSNSKTGAADMRIGWLLWKDDLDEFLYFEEEMKKPNPKDFYANWNETPARGARKSSRSLWIYEISTGKKKYSITTTAGAKIQPYFDIPAPNDPHLYHFQVQGVLMAGGMVKVWLTRTTAKYLELLLGSLEGDKLSEAIDAFEFQPVLGEDSRSIAEEMAIPIVIKERSYSRLKTLFPPISDESMFQQFARQLHKPLK